MKILMATSETVPFSKSGGLADVVGALSATLSAMGHEVRVFMPMYSFIEKEGWNKSLSFLLPMLGGNEKAEIYEKEENGVVYVGLSHPYFSIALPNTCPEYPEPSLCHLYKGFSSPVIPIYFLPLILFV